MSEQMDRPTIGVDEMLAARRSVRAFLDKPVPRAMIEDILDAARWAPSGGNLQPWRVIVVAGEARREVVALAAERLGAGGGKEDGEYPAYPPNLFEPYRTRRFAVGEAMYAELGLARDDRAARLAWLARNFDFFGAPAGLFFTIDRRLGHPQWAHLGMMMQSVALAASARGLGTCFQEAWGIVRDTLHGHFQLDPEQLVFAGMALGYADEGHPVNRLRSEREPVAAFASFYGAD